MRATQARLGIARENLAAQDDTLQIAEWRVQAGLVSALDAEQARASRAQTAATIPTLEANLAAALNRIGGLIGAAPGESEEHTSELQSIMRNSYAVFGLKKKNN